VVWIKRILKWLFLGGAALALFSWVSYHGWLGLGISVLDGLALQPGDAVVGLSRHWGENEPVSKRIGSFYVDDPAILKRMAAQWRTGGPAPYFLCGYHYSLYLLSKGEIKREFSINLETGCNTIVDENENPHWFEPSLIEAFEADYKKPLEVEKTFASLEEGRRYLSEVKKDPAFLMLLEPEWKVFDGTLRFKVHCDLPEDGAARVCLSRVESEIRKKYPGEELAAESKGEGYSNGKLNEMEIALACKESLRKKFDLYELEKDGWRPYEPKLSVVFKKT
jgi:hypothetical protein